jgi:hypothetical protein
MAAEHDRPDLTQAQREALLDLLHEAFVYLRSPGYGYFWVSQEDWNKLEKVQAAVDWSVAIGEALHNIPKDIYGGNFDFKFHKAKIACYVDRNPRLAEFIARLEEIEAMDGRSPPAGPETKH